MDIYQADLLAETFACCDQKDLWPVACNLCRQILVICAHCKTAFRNLNDLNDKVIIGQTSGHPLVSFNCPRCDRPYEHGFYTNSKYNVRRQDVSDQGLDNILKRWANPDLNHKLFHCCGNEDLLPIQCPTCHHIMIECFECSTLFPDLRQPSSTASTFQRRPHSAKCNFQFEEDYFKKACYRVADEDFLKQGLNFIFAPTIS